MLSNEQNNLIHELISNGIQLNSTELNGMPCFQLNGFADRNVYLLPLIDTKRALFEISNITHEPISHSLVNGIKTTHANTRVNSIDEMIYYYYHFYKIMLQKQPSFQKDPAWAKTLEKYDYQVKFNRQYIKEHIVQYFLNTTLISETNYSVK